MVELSISIVNTNNRQFLDECLGSIYANTAGISFEVFVVDNASDDGSAKMLSQKYPQVRLIQNHLRKGFAANHNRVLSQSNGRYILILNEDTIILPGTLQAMLKFMNEHPKAGAIGPKKLNPDGSTQPDRGRPYNLALMVADLFRLYKLLGRNEFSGGKIRLQKEPVQVEMVSGCCLLLRREVIEEIGLLDETFFLYCEDDDYSRRIGKAGWKMYYLSQAAIIHYAGKAVFPTKGIEQMKSQAHYFRKYYGQWSLIIIQPIFFIRQLVAISKWILLFFLKKPLALKKMRLNWQLLLLSLEGLNLYKLICKITLLIFSLPFLPYFLWRKISKRKIAPFYNILVIKMSALGDLLLSTPVLRALKETFPQSKITLLVSKDYKEIIQGSPYIDDYIVVDFFPRLQNFKDIKKIIKTISSIRDKSFDLVVNLDSTLISGIITLLSKASLRIGQFSGIEGFFYDSSYRSLRGNHYIDNTLSIVQLVGVDTRDKNPYLAVEEKDFSFAMNFLRENGIGEKDLIIGIHPGAGNPFSSAVKQWPEENFARLADELEDQFKARIILMGTEQENPVVNKIIRLMNNQPAVAVGKTTVKQLAALISRCNLLICHDSLPLHIAVAIKTPTVSIWSSFSPSEYGPRTDRFRHRIVVSNLVCHPCWQYRCRLPKARQWQCIRSIEPQEVLKETASLLADLGRKEQNG